MTISDITRRAAVMGLAAAPAASASDQVPALGADDPDAELRRLWSIYQQQGAELTAARLAYEPARDAFDTKIPPCPDGVLPGKHWDAYQWLYREYGIDRLYDAMSDADSRLWETVDEIRSTPAHTAFGVAVKIVATPEHWQPEDLEYSVKSALVDLSRMTGTEFSIGNEKEGGAA